MAKILFTGGGTSGHVTPNIALFPYLKEKNYEIVYIGSEQGIEQGLIEKENIKYYAIPSGKLRRYFSWQNFTDIFKIIAGTLKAYFVIRKEKPNITFSKGGYVSTPVVWASWLNHIPVIIHESDITPGLANKLALPFSKKICHSFPETQKYIDKSKAVFTGLPIRKELFEGSREKGLAFCGFTPDKPIILIMGGSQGAKAINSSIRNNLDKLLKNFQICHLCGKGNKAQELDSLKGYKQYEYISDELKDLFAMCDFMISRAGATSVFEILALKKANILIPLSKKSSRGDQILNAESFRKQGFSLVIDEDELTDELLLEKILYLKENKNTFIENMEKAELKNAIEIIVNLIDENRKK